MGHGRAGAWTPQSSSLPLTAVLLTFDIPTRISHQPPQSPSAPISLVILAKVTNGLLANTVQVKSSLLRLRQQCGRLSIPSVCTCLHSSQGCPTVLDLLATTPGLFSDSSFHVRYSELRHCSVKAPTALCSLSPTSGR